MPLLGILSCAAGVPLSPVAAAVVPDAARLPPPPPEPSETAPEVPEAAAPAPPPSPAAPGSALPGGLLSGAAGLGLLVLPRSRGARRAATASRASSCWWACPVPL